MKCRCVIPLFCTMMAESGRGQPGLMHMNDYGLLFLDIYQKYGNEMK